MSPERHRIVIAGGGILGLGLAYQLSRASEEYDITLIERSPRLGGAISWLDLKTTTVDRFYHAILSEDGTIFRILDDLGLKDSYGFSETRMGIFSDGRTYPMATAFDFLKYPHLGISGKLRLAYTLLHCRFKKHWQDIEHLRAGEWLSSVGGRSNYENLWYPIMRSKFGNGVDELTAVDMYSRIKRLSGSRKGQKSQKIAYIRGTLKTFVQALERRLNDKGVTVCKDSAIQAIEYDKDRISGLRLSDGRILQADTFVFSLPVPDFRRMIPDPFQQYRDRLGALRYLDNMSLILLLKRPLTPYYMLNLRDRNCPFTGVIGTAHIYPEDHFNGNYVFYISRYLFGKKDEELGRKSADEVFNLYLPYLKKINPDFDRSWVVEYVLSKGRNAEPFHSVNYSAGIPPETTPFQNGFLLSNAQIYPEITTVHTSLKLSEAFSQKLPALIRKTSQSPDRVPAPLL